MKAEIMTITPDTAAKWLKGNIKNRPLSKTRVTQISNAIKRGEWECNGETIIMNGSRLLDGQHRLAGCVMADMPIRTFVVQGAEAKVFHTIDSGVSRSAGDVLSMAGVHNANVIVAALKWVHKYETGNIQGKIGYTTPQVEELYEKHPGISRSAAVCRNNRLAPGSIVTASHYLFAKLDADAAEVFFRQFTEGADLAPGDPVLLLRERLMANKLSRTRLREPHIFALIIKAWNARREGKTLRTLKWRETGPMTEPFPVIK